MSRRSDREEQAHRYAEVAGWPVLAVEPGGKRPIPGHGVLDATTGHKAIEGWWRSVPNANVAIATGGRGPDVLDIDVHKGGTGYGPLRELQQAGLLPAPQAVVRTPSGGAHLYYQGSGQRNGHLAGKHLDYRGLGGYVVAPPSRIAHRQYEVLKHQPSDATFDWAAAKQLLDPQPERQPYRAPERGEGKPRDLSHLPGWVASQPEGSRNHGLFWASCRAAEAGDTATLTSLANAARAAGLDEREIGRTIASAQQTAGRGTGRSFEHTAPVPSAAVELDPQAEAEAGALPGLACKRPRHGVPAPHGTSIPPQSTPRNEDLMFNTTTQARTATAEDVPPPAASVEEARVAWATAPRDAELDRWNALYDRAVPAPQTAMTTWERHEAGWPARDADERAGYRELDAVAARPGAEREAGQ